MLVTTADVGPRELGQIRDLAEPAHAHLDDGVAMARRAAGSSVSGTPMWLLRLPWS